MIYTLTLNPTIDYYLTSYDFAPGKISRAEDAELIAGGKGINVSLMLGTLGVDSIALGFIAGETGQLFSSMVSKKNIKSDFIEVAKGFTRINVKISSDRETDINAKGPTVQKEDIQKLFKKLDCLNDGDYLVMAGSVSNGLGPGIYSDIMSHLTSKNIKIALDTTGDALLECLDKNPYVIKPNHIELGELFGKELEEDDDILLYAKKLVDMGAQNVLVSIGAKGAMLVTKDGGVYRAYPPKGEVVSTIGAGDSALAGFIAATKLCLSDKEKLDLSVCCGSATAYTKGLADRQMIENLMKNNK